MTGERKAAGATPESGLYKKLAIAQKEVESVGKGGRNENHGYDYTKADDVIRAASAAITGAGLVAWTEGPGGLDRDELKERLEQLLKVEGGDLEAALTRLLGELDAGGLGDGSGFPYELEIQEGTTSNNKRSLMVTARGRLVILDPETGERQHFPLIGTGTDTPGDKAIYKAVTGGAKYAWQAALQIAFGDDPEDDSSPGAQAAADQAPKRNGRLPQWAEQTAADELERVQKAIQFLIGAGELDDAIESSASRIFDAVVEDAGGSMPRIASRSILRVAAEVKARVEQGDEPGPGELQGGAEPEGEGESLPPVEPSPGASDEQDPASAEPAGE